MVLARSRRRVLPRSWRIVVVEDHRQSAKRQRRLEERVGPEHVLVEHDLVIGEPRQPDRYAVGVEVDVQLGQFVEEAVERLRVADPGADVDEAVEVAGDSRRPASAAQRVLFVICQPANAGVEKRIAWIFGGSVSTYGASFMPAWIGLT